MARSKTSRPSLKVNLGSCKYEVIREAAERLGYEVAEEEDEQWDLQWSDMSVTSERVQKMKAFQRLNHFPCMLEICRKAALSRHISRMAGRLHDEYRFYPYSVVLPDQLEDFVNVLKRNKARVESGSGSVQTYILKPSGGTMGRGIHLVQTVQQLQELDITNVVAQQYVGNPLLLDGYKFDLRIYALVMSVDPLKIYLYDEGLARLATEPYEPPSQSNLRVPTMHLTNYAINKNSTNFVSGDESGGSKRLVSQVLAQVAEAHQTTRQQLMDEIGDIVVKTVLAIQPLLAHTYHTAIGAGSHQSGMHPPPCQCLNLEHVSTDSCSCTCSASQCFELLGFDIMFDDKLQPWLLEVNHSPSFSCDARIDKHVKSELLQDTIAALGQRAEARMAYFEAEARALNDRLYNPVTASIRRPLSAIPRSKQLQAAAAALDELAASAGPSGSHKHSGSSSARGSGSNSSHGPSQFPQQPDSECSSSYAHLEMPTAASLPSRLGKYRQIFPAGDEQRRKRYLRIMQAAADAFPDQRCQCAWCARRRELKLMQLSARDLASLSSSIRRPASADFPMRPLLRSPSSMRVSTPRGERTSHTGGPSGGGTSSIVARELRPSTSQTPGRAQSNSPPSAASGDLHSPESSHSSEVHGEDSHSSSSSSNTKEDKIIARYMRMLRATHLTPTANHPPTPPKPPRPKPGGSKPPSPARPRPDGSEEPQQLGGSGLHSRVNSAGSSGGTCLLQRQGSSAEAGPTGHGSGHQRPPSAAAGTAASPDAGSPLPPQAPGFPRSPSARLNRSQSWSSHPLGGSPTSGNGAAASSAGKRGSGTGGPGTSGGPPAGALSSMQGLGHSYSGSGAGAAGAAGSQGGGLTPRRMSSSNGASASYAAAGGGDGSRPGTVAAAASADMHDGGSDHGNGQSWSSRGAAALVPRVAYLAEMKRQQQQAQKHLDPELMAMRMKTASLLSNRYVSVSVLSSTDARTAGKDQQERRKLLLGGARPPTAA